MKLLLPDKSFWMCLDPEQLDALVSKYTIFCPPILFTEIARRGLKPYNSLRNIENIIAVSHWFDQVKKDLLTEESSKPIPFTSANAMKAIRESSEQELLEIKEASNETIEVLIEGEDFYKSQASVINASTQKLFNAVEGTKSLSEQEWVDTLKQVLGEPQVFHPEIEHVLRKIDAEGFRQEWQKALKPFIEELCNTYKADSLENACKWATNLLDHEPLDRAAAHEKLQRLCVLFRSILTPEDHTQIFNRFLKEDMPPIRRFAPYALRAAIWNFTIQSYLRENPDDIAPPNVLRDAEYLYYVPYKDVTFVSGDKWHKIFVDEVPLFEGVRENFLYVHLTSKETIQEGLSKIL